MKQCRVWIRVMFLSAAGSVVSNQSVEAQWQEDDCEQLLEVQSFTQSDFFGWTVISLGDVNDDGVIDVAVSSPFTGAQSFGMIRVYSGADGSQIWSRSENLQSAVLGFAMEVAGDWNDDGVLDVLAGAPFNGPTGGRVWVYSGTDGATLHILNPSDVPGDSFGVALATGGDYNGDGIDDVLVGSFGVDAGGDNAGRVYVYSSGSGALITTIDGSGDDSEFGIGLSFLGDINDDGRDEIIVGQRLPDFWSGLAHVYSWNGLGSTLEYTIEGVGMGYNLIGDRIEGGRDLNGDDIPDFIVGDMQAGEAPVFSGSDGTLLYTLAPPGEVGDFAGCHIIDDIDGDGVADVLGASWFSDAGAPGAGKVFLFSGVDGAQIRTMTYTVPDGGLATDVRAAGDVNGDGALDFLVGGTGGGFNGPPTGRIFILAGIAMCPAADLDGDCVVGAMDLAILLGNWGPCPDPDDCPADLNGDGQVSAADLAILLGNWGA